VYLPCIGAGRTAPQVFGLVFGIEAERAKWRAGGVHRLAIAVRSPPGEESSSSRRGNPGLMWPTVAWGQRRSRDNSSAPAGSSMVYATATSESPLRRRPGEAVSAV